MRFFKNKVHNNNNIVVTIYTKDDIEKIENKNKNMSCLKHRSKNIGKWLVALAGFPLAYIMLPVSCCVRNPAAMVLYDEENKKDLPRMSENLAVGISGMVMTVCCCGCFLGECGAYGPKEF